MKKKLTLKKEIFIFSIASGIFFMGNVVTSLIIPLQMVDQGLSYGVIGGVIASFSLGMIVIKLIIGRHSDIVGTKSYLLISTIGSAIFTILLAMSHTMNSYIVLLGMLGVCRGMFTSVNSSYMFAITKQESRGKEYGRILGISSLFMACGGVLAGSLYSWSGGQAAFYIIGMLLLCSALLISKFLPSIIPSKEKSSHTIKELFKMNKKLMLVCVIIFLQAFVTSPMWNMVIPMYFYQTFAYSAMLLGIVMSLDEFIGLPVYMFGGYLADKMNIKKMNILCCSLAGIVALGLLLVDTPIAFLVLFLVCSAMVTCTYIAIPKMQSPYVRNDFKGFELALVSVSASIGETLGNMGLGHIMDIYSIKGGVVLFCIFYLIIVILFIIGFRRKRI